MNIELDMCSVILTACSFVLTTHSEGWMIVLYKCALPHDGLDRPETCSSLRVKTLLYF